MHIKGRGENRTDLRVALAELSDPDTQTLFENCVADVNIPVGEVFTSPKLSGTEGTLHVTQVYLSGLLYRDLELRFQDGMVREYSCGNFEEPEKNLEYIRENPDYDNYSYTCQGSISLSDGNGGTQSLACYHNTVHGTQNLFQSFANSCNASFANIGTTLDASGFSKLASELLFNQKLPTSIPHVQSSFSISSSDSDWLTGATAIGQGNTTMTPLHAAMLTSAIANGGVLMEPYLVDHVQSSDGHTVKKYMPQSYGSLISTSEASILTDMMIGTVQSGTATALSTLGYSVAGKTGTAEIDNYGNNAWFVGFAPAENPQIAVCVLVENASTSSSYVAVPIAQQLFAAYVR